MADAISQRLRREMRARSGGRCEYCRLPEAALLFGCEVDHIISRKHGGTTVLSNLALSCARCNRAKGTDIGSIPPTNGAFTRLFNPRVDIWDKHFVLKGARIDGVTEIGQATVALLRLNDAERLLERSRLKAARRY